MKFREPDYPVRSREVYSPQLIVQEKSTDGWGQHIITDACSGFRDGDRVVAIFDHGGEQVYLEPGDALCMIGRWNPGNSATPHKWLWRPPCIAMVPRPIRAAEQPKVLGIIFPSDVYYWFGTSDKSLKNKLMAEYMAMYKKS